MPIIRGSVICSKAGRDSEGFLVVLEVKGAYVIVADGKQRPIQRPKLKNLKHIALTKTVLAEEQLLTNKSIRHALSDFKATFAKER